MTKKQRVMQAIRHQESDKVPKGETAIDGELANRLLGTSYPLDYQHFERDRQVRELLHIDLINLGDWPAEKIGTDGEGGTIFRSLYGYEYRYSGQSKQVVKPPLDDIKEAASYPVPDITKVSGSLISRFAEQTDLYIFAQIGGPVSMLDEMFEMEDFLVYCLTDTKQMCTMAERVMEFEIAKAKLFLDSGADAVLLADDIAYNGGLFLPPSVMQELVYPFYASAVAEIKKYRDVPVFFHSDGNLHSELGVVVACGFDGLHSLQPSAGMDIGRIKKEYGDVLCLMGNIDLDYVMTFASPAEVAATVERTIDIAAPGGGFILSTCNSLVNAVPPENALAMYRTAESYGGSSDE